MELIRGKHNIRDRIQGCVVTLGNFDGVHLGHQQLLRRLKAVGQTLKLPTVVIVFEPQPKEFFSKKQTMPRLMRFREKWLALKKYEIDYVLCLHFNKTLANLLADDFVKQILVEQLNAKTIVVGDDFRFGAKRAGDCALLEKLGKKWGFGVIQMHTVIHDGERASSTRVREALQAGDLSLARRLLGRSYRLCGKVVHGDKRGRDLGFPTANIHLYRRLVPLSGIFVIRVCGLDKVYEGVASIGTRPTFADTRVVLEVYLFDFDGDLYGKALEIEFLHKLRDEIRYESLDALVEQIHQDVQDAKAYFKRFVNSV